MNKENSFDAKNLSTEGCLQSLDENIIITGITNKSLNDENEFSSKSY